MDKKKESLETRFKKSKAVKEHYLELRGGPNQSKDSRFDLQHRLWREACLERDGHQCQICGATEDLVAHHITPVKDAPELEHVIQNGQTVCRSCHPKLHKGQKRTPEQRARIGEGVKRARAAKAAIQAQPSSC